MICSQSISTLIHYLWCQHVIFSVTSTCCTFWKMQHVDNAILKKWFFFKILFSCDSFKQIAQEVKILKKKVHYFRIILVFLLCKWVMKYTIVDVQVAVLFIINAPCNPDVVAWVVSIVAWQSSKTAILRQPRFESHLG